MKRLACLFVLMAFAVFYASCADAARPAPKLKEMGGQQVATDYFTLTIPTGWSMPMPAQKMPDGGVNVLFASMSQAPAVTISIMKNPATAKQIAEMTTASMRKGGMEVSEPMEKDGFWVSDLTQGKQKGKVLFGSADGHVSVTIIVGGELEKADEILKAMDVKIKGLLPMSVN